MDQYSQEESMTRRSRQLKIVLAALCSMAIVVLVSCIVRMW